MSFNLALILSETARRTPDHLMRSPETAQV
jgi:hypothetical protein